MCPDEIEPGVDDEFLRNLDKTPSGCLHRLLCATDTFGMRALDYRAPRKGIHLVIARPFANQRELE